MYKISIITYSIKTKKFDLTVFFPLREFGT